MPRMVDPLKPYVSVVESETHSELYTAEVTWRSLFAATAEKARVAPHIVAFDLRKASSGIMCVRDFL